MPNKPNKLKILKVRDKTDKNVIKMDKLFDVNFRLLLVSRSGGGKSNYLTNILLNSNLPYKNIFEGENIYIFAPNVMADEKLKTIVEEKDIPEGNLLDDISNDTLSVLYEELIERFHEANAEGEKPDHSLIIIDDFGFSGQFSNQNRFGMIQKLFCNSRKFGVSIILLIQQYSQASNTIRSNATGMVIFNQSNAELELIEKENNYLTTKKQFLRMFRDKVREKHDALVINYSNGYELMYMSRDFEEIDYLKYDQ